MASGPKTRARVLTVEHPGFIKSLRAVNTRKFSESKRKSDEMPPPQFEGANSPLALYESTEVPKMSREREFRKDYRSPPGVAPRPILQRSRPKEEVRRQVREVVAVKTPAIQRVEDKKIAPPKPKLRPVAPAPKKTKRQRFNEAFASARKQGKREFVFEGKKFNTKTK